MTLNSNSWTGERQKKKFPQISPVSSDSSGVSYYAVLLVAVIDLGHVAVILDAAVQNAANGQHQLYWKRKQTKEELDILRTHNLGNNFSFGCSLIRLHALTYVSGRCVFVSKLVELPGSHGVHLDEGDAATAPLPLRFVDGEEGLEEQIDDAFGDRMGIDGQAGQQVVHAAHVPKLCGTHET